MKRLDAVSLSLVVFLILSITGINAIGSQINLDISLNGADVQNNLEVGPYGPLTFAFSRAVQQDLLPPQIKITPAVAGAIVWDDPTHAEFIPNQPLRPGVGYTIVLGKGAIGKSGEKIKADLTWTFQLRRPLVTYISKSASGEDVWSIDPDGSGPPTQITHSNGSLFDYAPSPNGELIVYSVINSKQGFDLWVINRDGQENHILLDCGLDRCSTASWDIRSDQIVYVRQSAGISPDAPLGTPRPWLLDVRTGETQPLYSDPQAIGFGPSWSPDGLKVASFDGVKSGIQILDIKTQKNVFIPTISGEVGSWSPDSQKMYYTDIVENKTGYNTQVYMADASTGETQQIFTSPELAANFNYDVPAASPKGDWLAVAVQSQPTVPGYQMWLISPDEQNVQAITSDPSYTYSEYSWDALGDTLLFQSDQLGAGENSETLIWQNKGQPARVIAKGASMPRWLP